MSKRTLIQFDIFSYTCPYFQGEAPINNGYGCGHPECGEASTDGSGNRWGHCHLFTYPLCCRLVEDELQNPELDLDGQTEWAFFSEDGRFIGDGEYATISAGEYASDDERAALLAYERYLHRYDLAWLSTHP